MFFMVTARSCTPRSITGTNLPEAKIALPGLLSGGCTYDDVTKESRLYQLDTSFRSTMLKQHEWHG